MEKKNFVKGTGIWCVGVYTDYKGRPTIRAGLAKWIYKYQNEGNITWYGFTNKKDYRTAIKMFENIGYNLWWM